jgi:putative ABC transport system ATP-binding protein
MQLEALQDLFLRLEGGISRADLKSALRHAEEQIVGSWEETWIKRLELIASRINLRIDHARQSICHISDMLHPETIALFLVRGETPEHWIMLLEARGRAVKIHDPLQPAASRWLGESEFAKLIGLSSKDELTDCLLIESPLACRAASVEDDSQHDTPHGEHAAAGHHAHGHGMPPFKRLLQLFKPDAAEVWAIIWYAVGIGILMLATPIAVEAMVTSVAFGGILQPVVVLAVVLFCCLLFAAILRAMQTYLVEILQRRIFIRVTTDLARRLPRVKVSAYDGHHGPELVNRFFDVLTVQKISASLLMDGITIVLQTLIGLLVVAFYHPLLLALVICLIVGMVLIVFGLGRGAIRTSIDESIAKYRVAEWLQELARYPQSFKSAEGASFAMRRIDLLGAEYLINRNHAFRIVFRQIIASLLMQAIAATALLGVGGWLVISNAMTLGQLVASELIISAVVLSFVKFGKHLESFYDLMAATDKLGHLLDLELEPTATEILPLDSRGAALAVTDLSFGYEGHETLLDGLNLQLAAGERLGINALAGSGKSTFAEILHGLRTPSDGRISIEGNDYRDIQLESLRTQTALVSGPQIFEGSVLDNVRMGRDEIPTAEIRRVLAQVGLLDEISGFPDGLQTVLVTGGRPLSNSQSLRLMIARAIIGKPRLLIIDETLDALRGQGDEALLDLLFDRAKPWSLVLISGQPSYLARCDRVVTLTELSATAA